MHVDIIEGSEWERDSLMTPARNACDDDEDILNCSRDPLVCDAADITAITEEYKKRQVLVCI
jgi:hypothetical protein